MNLAIIIAARLDSSRLPGKALLDISGRPALGLLLERLRQSESGDHIIVATTDRATDDPIAELRTTITCNASEEIPSTSLIVMRMRWITSTSILL